MNKELMRNTANIMHKGINVCWYCGKVLNGYQSCDGDDKNVYYKCNCDRARTQIALEDRINELKELYKPILQQDKQRFDESIKMIDEIIKSSH